MLNQRDIILGTESTAAYLYGSETFEDKTNGHGYWYNYPNVPNYLDESSTMYFEPISTAFDEFDGIIQTAVTEGSILVTGAPGCGKSTLTRDIQEYAQQNNISALRIALHINSGKSSTIPDTIELLESFKESTKETGGLLIIDNVDYVAYRGKRRKLNKAVTYAEHLVPALVETIEQPHIKTIGTSHNEEWQANKWQWDDLSISTKQQELIEAFRAAYMFEGRVSLSGLQLVLKERIQDEQRSKQVASMLAQIGANFFVAKHIDPDTFETSPQQAIEQINVGRQLRLGASVQQA